MEATARIGAAGPTPAPREPSRVMAMPHPKQGKQKARTWREIRAQAVKEGRLDEARLEAHKRRLLAEERAHAERQQGGDDA